MNPMQGVFQGFDITNSALSAEMQRSEVVAANLANMHVTGNSEREPYRRKSVVFEEILAQANNSLADVNGGDRLSAGVRVREVVEDRSTQFFEAYDPGHPDANEQGFVLRSNVDMFRELMDLTVVRRSFQANLAAMRTYRTMLQATIQNFRS
ncbi:MAG: flagellar basal body rod protein FlgC [Planctomycetes bacterium]|nr:flagellar basal body rod protein FlgC [Planctomycetota bacterium]